MISVNVQNRERISSLGFLEFSTWTRVVRILFSRKNHTSPVNPLSMVDKGLAQTWIPVCTISRILNTCASHEIRGLACLLSIRNTYARNRDQREPMEVASRRRKNFTRLGLISRGIRRKSVFLFPLLLNYRGWKRHDEIVKSVKRRRLCVSKEETIIRDRKRWIKSWRSHLRTYSNLELVLLL